MEKGTACGVVADGWVRKSAGELAGMRVLTVREPWASLIVGGFKTIENRSRRFGHRGPLLIHASRSLTTAYYEAARMWVQAHVAPGLYEFPDWKACMDNRGKIVGGCLLDDCRRAVVANPWRDDSEWGLVLSNAWQLVGKIPAKGALGLWTFNG